MPEEEKQRLDQIVDRLLSEQNFGLAIVAGAIATVLAAAVCGVAIASLRFAYGFGVVGVGVVIGWTIQFLGRGVTTKFTVLAVAYTMAGCALGPVIARVAGRMNSQLNSPIEVLSRHPLPELAAEALSGLSLMYLLYVFMAVVFAIYLVERPLTREERLAIGHYRLKRPHD